MAEHKSSDDESHFDISDDSSVSGLSNDDDDDVRFVEERAAPFDPVMAQFMSRFKAPQSHALAKERVVRKVKVGSVSHQHKFCFSSIFIFSFLYLQKRKSSNKSKN